MFYKPKDGWCADFIPFYENGKFYLFYLHDYRNPEVYGEGTPWRLLITEDFLHFQEIGEVIPRGSSCEQDLYVFTGSVFREAPGRYHLFYTGHNPHFPQKGKPMEGVQHATSSDLIHWTKEPELPYFAPGQFEADDWRDPFVFQDETGVYHMLLAARLKQGNSRRRGITATAVSKDLFHWSSETVFYAPNEYYTHECPDYFYWNGWYYLIFSEFSAGCQTRYRMSRSPHGPWTVPACDTFDTRAFYAAKSVSDGENRYLIGWISTREQSADMGKWQWGGNLAVHQLIQNEDGTLAVMPPPKMRDLDTIPFSRFSILFDNLFDYRSQLIGEIPDAGKLCLSFRYEEISHEFGIALFCDSDLEKGYFLRFFPQENRIALDKWPRGGDIPYFIESQRPFQMVPGQDMEVTLFWDRDLITCYFNGQSAMSFRLYERGGASFGVYSNCSHVCWKNALPGTSQ